MQFYPTNAALIWKQSVLRRHGATVLMFLGFVLMCALAFEQNRTINTQRELINSLFRDSLELNVLKIQQAQASK